MRQKFYISHYSEYPIYEPAEGGYYYAGAQLDFSSSYPMTLKKAQRELQKIFNEYKEEGYEQVSNNKVCLKSKYIGEEKYFIIEKRKGENESNYKSYC